MRSFILKLAIVATILFSSHGAFAADGSSGCGPGWYVFKKNSLVSSALRGTTNGILGLFVTLGMTFGTSNCAKHSIVLRDKEVERFLAHNYSSFQHDSAKGNGEYLQAVSQMYNCNFIGAERFSHAVQDSFGYLFNEDNSAYEVTVKLNDVVHYDHTLKSHCSII